MTENKRFFKIMYDYDWWFVFDKKQEYIETECPTPHTKASDLIPMTEEQVVELLNENELLKQENNNLRDFRGFITEKNVFNEKERKELQLQLSRLYNYFENYFEDTMSPIAFGEMWDNVKEDEKWEKR